MNHSVGVISLGCAKNRVDTEQMLGLLREWGYTITADPSEAEILIVNTCGFIDPAKQESIDAILEMAEYKQTGRCRLLVATGCLVQRYSDTLVAEIPELDVLLGVGEYPRLRTLLEEAFAGKRPVACNRSADVFEGPRILTTPSFSAFVRTGDGCDNRCAYCAIPLIRGGYRSRPYANVLAEAEALVRQGAKEITYIAQDTTRFADDLPGGKTLADLLADTAAIDAAHWVRALYCYPSRVDDRLLDVMAENPKVCGYLDLPLQHIDGEMLRRMNRQGSPDDIRALIKKIRARDLVLRTTMIVGFPGETEEAFSRLLDFVQEVRFDRLGAFTYSVEEDTAAATMPDQVPEDVKEERLDRLMRLQQQIAQENGEKRIGETCEVLIEREESGRYIGRSAKEAPEGDGCIMLHSARALNPGDFVTATITAAQTYDLMGEVK